MKRLHAFALGLLIAVSVGVAADSVVPSRLRLQSLGVGRAAPAVNGDIIANHNIIVVNDLMPNADNVSDFGAPATSWRNVYIDGIATVATLTATSATVGGSAVCTAANGVCAVSQVLCPGPCNGAAITAGQTFVVTKAADVTRQNTATFADDNELIVSNLPIGAYQIFIQWTLDAVDANGSRAGLSVTGVPSDEANGGGAHTCNGGFTGLYTQWTTTATLALCAQADDESGYIHFHMANTSTGSAAFQWAQNTSSANGTTLRRRSNMTVRRVY